MSKNVILLTLFVLLGGATTWYLMAEKPKTQQMSTMLGQDRLFAVKDINTIHKIFLADRKGNKTTLVKNGQDWIYNDQYLARPNAMENLLNAISKVEMKYKPSDAAVPNMVKDLASNGIKVEIYNQADELLKAYYVGGATNDETGTYMIMENAEQPYVAHLPGWTGNLRFRYNLTGSDWRDKHVFQYEVEEIQSVSIAYPKQKNKSFVLERQENKRFGIRPFYEGIPPINKSVKQGVVEAFLVGFESVGAEGFETENPKRDSVSQLIPFSTITVTTTKGDTQLVSLHPIYVTQSGYDFKKNKEIIKSPTTERYFANIPNSNDFMLVQHRVFSKLLWEYKAFF